MNKTINQFIYTASPWGHSDPGWMVFAASENMDVLLADSLQTYYTYNCPDGLSHDPSDGELEKYPVQYVVAKVKNGEFMLVSQTTFTGRRWYDPRPGDWLANGFVVPVQIYKTAICDKHCNPFSWYKSNTFISHYLQEWKNKAYAINNRTIPYENPPTLPMFETMEEALDLNSDYDFQSSLDSMEGEAFNKIGKMLFAIMHRNERWKALVFDALNSKSAKTMSLLLELLPGAVRSEVEFASYLHREDANNVNADSKFIFYGTVREGVEADLDTGLYGDELPTDGVILNSIEDVKLLKQIIDDGYTEFVADDFDSFVSCWMVVIGKDRSIAGMRNANIFCLGEKRPNPRFESLHTLLHQKISEQLSGDAKVGGLDIEWCKRVAVAYTELDVKLDDDFLKYFCRVCVSDKTAFNEICTNVGANNSNLYSLFKLFERFLSDEEIKLNLAKRLQESYTSSVFDGLTHCEDIPFTHLVLRYCNLQNLDVGNANVSDGDIEAVSALKEEVGGAIVEIDDTLAKLKYWNALAKIECIDDVLNYLEPPFPPNANIIEDLCGRLKSVLNSPSTKIEMALVLDKLGKSGNEYIVSEWEKDLLHIRQLEEKVKQSKMLLKQKDEQHRISARYSLALCIAMMALSGVIGWFANKWFVNTTFFDVVKKESAVTASAEILESFQPNVSFIGLDETNIVDDATNSILQISGEEDNGGKCESESIEDENTGTLSNQVKCATEENQMNTDSSAIK